ncbi:MAG: ABC transporter transmembrane domain-containing protein [Pseudomonadota bacterium]
MNTSLLSFIWQYSKKDQVRVIALTLLSFPILYYSLEIPKIIINKALSNSNQVNKFLGLEMEVIPYLVALCFSLLALIIVNGILKMRINTMKGTIGEKLVRRLRFQLIDRMLRFPLPHFARTSQGELISTVTAEAEPLGGYIAESIALPLFQGGTMITILLFMFMQDWVFGLASVALIPVQAYVIPKLQMQVNALKKERVKRVRKLSERIGETVSGAREIRLQGTQNYTLSEFSHWFSGLYHIRLEIFKKKFFMKFLNNTIGQITPFVFYLFGGILVIKGDLTIGALVAALAAYKDLTSPWKELLNFYQLHEDSKIKYQQIQEQFSPTGLLPQQSQSASVSETQHLRSTIALESIGWQNESGESVISGLNAQIEPGSWVAIVGENAMQRMRLAQILAGIETPSSGRYLIGSEPMQQINAQLIHGKLVYQGPDPHMFSGTIRENVLYGLNRRPPNSDPTDQNELVRVQEAKSSGNIEYSFQGNWLDYSMVGVSNDTELRQVYLQNAKTIGADGIMYQRGLLEFFEPDDYPDLASRILDARQLINQKIKSQNLETTVARFNPDLYNRNATVAENILFGIPESDSLRIKNLASHPCLTKILKNLDLIDKATLIGAKAALRVRQRFERSSDGQAVLAEFDLDDRDEMERLCQLAESYLGRKDQSLEVEEQQSLLSIVLHLIPQKHQFGFINDQIAEKLLQARHEFKITLPDELREKIIRFDADAYHPRLTVQDNLLFGRVVNDQPACEKAIAQIIQEVLEETGIKEDVMMLLTESQVGIGGSRLPTGARHRISTGRLLMKQPDIIIFHDALSPFDEADKQRLRSNMKQVMPEATVIWIDREMPSYADFDQLYRFSTSGKLIDAREPAATTEKPGMENESLIGRSAILGALSAEEQHEIAENSHRVTVQDGEFVYRSGNPGNNAYIILSGNAQSLRDPDDPDSVAGNLVPGESFGLMEIIAQRPRILSVKAVGDMELLRVSGSTLREIIDRDPRVVQTILRALTDQWASVNRKL